MLLLSVLYIFLGVKSFECLYHSTIIPKDTDILVNNFFANLEADVSSHNDSTYSAYIDSQVENFISLFKNGQKPRWKRSAEDFNSGGYPEMLPYLNIQVNNPKEIVLFKHEQYAGYYEWYAAVLDSEAGQQHTNLLTIYQYNETGFRYVTNVRINNGMKIAHFSVKFSTFLVIAEYTEHDEENKMHVYEFFGNTISHIQSLGMQYATDAIMWDINGEIYLAVAQEKTELDDNKYSYEVKTPILKLLNGHFNPIGEITTFGAKKLAHLSDFGNHYLIVTNYKDNAESTVVHSEVFKYDYATKSYIPHQKLKTYGAVDVKSFCFGMGSKKMHFLAIANTYDSNNQNDNVESFIYKLVDGYFIPFQNFEVEGTAVEFLPIFGHKFEFALLVSTETMGINAYTFDGWHFTEYHSSFYENIAAKSINFYYFNNAPVVTIASLTNIPNNILYVNFTTEDVHGHNEELELLEWCEQEIYSIENHETYEMDRAESLIRTSEDIEDNDESELHGIFTKIFEMNRVIEYLQMQTSNALRTDENIRLNGDLTIENAEILGTLQTSNLLTESINGINANNFLQNLIASKEGFLMPNNANFASISIHEINNVKSINNEDFSTLLKNDVEALQDIGLLLNKTGIFEDGIKTSKFNDVAIKNDSVLLYETDQVFYKGSLQATAVELEEFTANFVNEVAYSDWPNNLVNIRIQKLSVQDLTITGNLNDHNLDILFNSSLKKSGDQVITSPVWFETVLVKNLEIADHQNLRLVSEDFQIANAMFVEDPYFERLWLRKALSEIKVVDGVLEVLLKNSSQVQYISGTKTFENVTLLNVISLYGKLYYNSVDEKNPLIIVDNEITVDGNFSIHGKVTIEKNLVARNIYNKEKESLMKIQENGIRLNERSIPMHMTFLQEISVNELNVDKINDIDTNTWINKENPQIINGVKTFAADLTINGNFNAEKINFVDLNDLLENTLLTNLDQEIKGKITFENLHINNNFTLPNSSIKLAEYETTLEKILYENDNQSTIFLSDEQSYDKIFAKELEIFGNINAFNVTDILSGLVVKEKGIALSKNFRKLTVENLMVNSMDLQKFHGVVLVDENLNLQNDLSVENITFADSLNEVSSDVLLEYKARRRGDVPEDLFFDEITVYGDCRIESNRLNKVLLSEIIEDTIKINEPFSFTYGEFATELVSESNLNLEGHVEGIDYENLVSTNLEDPSNLEEIIFENNVTVLGDLKFAGSVNNYSLTNLCDFLHRQNNLEVDNMKNLVVHGNAVFEKGIQTEYVNGVLLESVTKNAWHSAVPLMVPEHIKFTDVYFSEDVKVEGYIDGVDIQLLQENSFTTNTHQYIPATLTFENGVLFEKGASIDRLSVENNINGVNFNQFLGSALINNTDQTFENTVYIENMTVNRLNSDFTVNGLDISTDVARTDKENVFSGNLTIQNLKITNLLVNGDDVKVQNVDISAWMRKAILKHGSFEIKGMVTFTDDVHCKKGFSVISNINGIKFDEDHVLLKNLPQNVTGLKIFQGNASKAKSLTITKNLNGVEFDAFIDNLVDKTSEVLVKTPMKFTDVLTTENVNFGKTLNNVNINQLLSDIINEQRIEQLPEYYVNLKRAAVELKKSAENRNVYLRHFELTQSFENNLFVFPVQIKDATKLVTVFEDAQARCFVINFYKWADNLNSFVLDTDMAPIIYEQQITYIAPVQYKDIVYLLVESNNNAYPYHENIIYSGNLLKINAYPAKTFDVFQTFSTNGTFETKSFELEGRFCLVSIENDNFTGYVYCSSHYEPFKRVQVLSKMLKQVEVLQYKDGVYIVTINYNEDPHVSIWKFEQLQNRFVVVKKIHNYQPQGISAIVYEEQMYLATFTGSVDIALPGVVHIQKFDCTTNELIDLQNFRVLLPKQLALHHLPSGEMGLHILTGNSEEFLATYVFEGLSGFVKKAHSIVKMSDKLTPFDVTNSRGLSRHYVLGQEHSRFNLIQAIFT